MLYEVPVAAVLAHRKAFEAAALRRTENRFVISSFLEVLTRAGAWSEAQRLAQASWEQVPDTTQMRPVKWSARLQLIAVSFEAAIAAGRMDDLGALGQEWRETAALIEKERQENAKRRDPFRGFLRSHQGR